jgi:predicted anti-sigma-YlaC factor YlaD
VLLSDLARALELDAKFKNLTLVGSRAHLNQCPDCRFSNGVAGDIQTNPLGSRTHQAIAKYYLRPRGHSLAIGGARRSSLPPTAARRDNQWPRGEPRR